MSERIVDKVKKRIGDLEQAIQRLDFVKRHLNKNSSEIKGQIHTSISRHLETLRNREVWLLGQVDQVLVGKEEGLQRQQARLNKALGILHSSLAHHASASATGSDIQDLGGEELDIAARHLVQALEELNNMELKAEETPYIAFRADQVALRESIMNYGRVDANGMPLLLAFAEEDKPSASLPRHLEEYEDTEHHVFYKALQDGMANSSNIRVSMPKLSSRVEDWLQRPMLQLSTSTADVSLKSPASETTVGTPMSQTTCAIQNWLSEIKHNPDLEDDDDFEIVDHSGSSQRGESGLGDDFEIVDHSGSSQRESPVDDEVKALAMDDQDMMDMFSHIPRDRRQWLLRGSSVRSGSTAEEDLRAFFHHIPKDNTMWLATARKQLESLDELKHGGWFRHIPTEMSTWLKKRSAYDKRQQALPDMFAHISHDKSMWLMKEQEAQVAEERSCHYAEAISMDSFGSASSASSPDTLISIPNLMKEYLAGASMAMESWLFRQEGQAVVLEEPEKAGLSDLPGVQKYLNSSLNPSVWLSKPAKEEAMDTQSSATSSTQFFSHISSNKSDWLLSGQRNRGFNSASPSQAIDLQKAPKDSLSQWLMSSSSPLTEMSTTATYNSPLDHLLHPFSQLSTSDWLMRRQRQDSDGTDSSTRSWRVLPDSPQSSTLSLHSVTTSGRQIPPLNLAPWMFQQNGQ